MKNIFIVMLLALTAFSAEARRPAPGPANGFWVIVTREGGPATTTVQYFDLQQHLLAEEQIVGVRLDGGNRRTCRMLNKKLQMALTTFMARK
jgi:hypothetical protein